MGINLPVERKAASVVEGLLFFGISWSPLLQVCRACNGAFSSQVQDHQLLTSALLKCDYTNVYFKEDHIRWTRLAPRLWRPEPVLWRPPELLLLFTTGAGAATDRPFFFPDTGVVCVFFITEPGADLLSPRLSLFLGFCDILLLGLRMKRLRLVVLKILAPTSLLYRTVKMEVAGMRVTKILPHVN